MKLPPLSYQSPHNLSDAVALLAQHEGAARVIAGGQSLMPLMSLRLAQPSLLVDLAKIADLKTISTDPLEIGAMVTWSEIERHKGLKERIPLLAEVVRHVAHYQIRNRGTLGGSLAHADPAAEFPAVAITLDAVLSVIGPQGVRKIAANDFFVNALETSLHDDEIIMSVHFPAWPAKRRWAFQEFARRHGDFAIAGIILFYDCDAQGRVMNAHVGLFGPIARAQRLSAVEQALNGQKLSAALIEAVTQNATAGLDIHVDAQGSEAYKRSLAGTLLKRGLLSTL
jgi:aerobic carbon-monoxide dehydrogenase medium subunit